MRPPLSQIGLLGTDSMLTFTDVADYATREWICRYPDSLLECLFCLGHSVVDFVIDNRCRLWQEHLESIFCGISPEKSAGVGDGGSEMK